MGGSSREMGLHNEKHEKIEYIILIRGWERRLSDPDRRFRDGYQSNDVKYYSYKTRHITHACTFSWALTQ